MSLNVLFVASEAVPLAKTGGLGDMVGACAGALQRAGLRVTVMLPGYLAARAQLRDARVACALPDLPGGPARILLGAMPDTGVPVLLFDAPALFDRPGNPYLDACGEPYADNAQRFAAFSHAAARVAGGVPGLPEFDIVQAHDWHAALVPLLVKRAGLPVRTVLTVHNLAFQGNFPLAVASEIGVPAEAAREAECFGRFSFLKAGLVSADRITTVSRTYAREILTDTFGYGMQDVLRARRHDLVAILNGIDNAVWNPSKDAYLRQPFFAADLSGKHTAKRQLQTLLCLPHDAHAPLLALGSRLTHQKMADVALQALPQLLEAHPRLQVAVLGCGERRYESGMAALAARYPSRMAAMIGYTERNAHMLHAGADLLLHGSRFEPCGLTPLYAMRYGTVPVASRVGGLVDTIADRGSPEAALRGATGFLFDGESPEAMVRAVEHALRVFAQPRAWRILQYNGMTTDFGWSQPAREYLALYRALVPRATPMPHLQHWPVPSAQPQLALPARRRRSTALSGAVRAHAVARAASREKIRA
ncbi:glycogen synthase GlgA [Ralstonia solanacearum]|uniref:glycogen synthase GlgA n=1 Tax=Ralstonia solanacearum TaxID=305 RepID=UPI00018167A0|nr:glycogen synthase GlgA [Ralstonia solanacearum]MDC6178586.1 glycogen synthase GlgA [Ralstonia solanacearum]MDC6212177.1 glycogen synthase GlgA [Ralstonia solanacearum]MDC6239799.1 glycogen synthase GlgA [Ralstonia solanacearum]MDD7801566.1 glycogen synthase GlgA [Ralstonia solanacearum]